MSSGYWVRPRGIILSMLAVGYLCTTALAVVCAQQRLWALLPYIGWASVLSVLALGVGVKVGAGGLLIRNALTQRLVAHERVFGVISGTDFSVVVHGGVQYQTGLRHTLMQPPPGRITELRRELAAPGQLPLRLVTMADIHATWRPNNPDLAPEVLRPERWRFYVPGWWQLALLVVWAVVVVSAGTGR